VNVLAILLQWQQAAYISSKMYGHGQRPPLRLFFSSFVGILQPHRKMRRQTLQKVAGGATNLHWREKLTSYSLANVGTHFL
jgi:hypothetical protein